MTTAPTRSPLTGDVKADFYSGALADHALERWTGWWCEIFLMPDDKVVIVANESTWNRFDTRTVNDVLADPADIGFSDDQQEARDSFYRRLRSGTPAP